MQFNPMDYPAVFLEPQIVSHHSAWVEHIPFAYTLTEMLRPRRLVELGVHAGDSYCAFCHAVKHLELSTQCFGIDTWTGDTHTGPYPADVLAKLRAHHDPRYAAFSKLMQMDFDSASQQFEPDSIDLLHIDGLHTYNAVKHDFETWLPKLSERAVVLFHDTMMQEEDFEVFRLWAELTRQYPHFHFEHGSGLGLLAVGKEVPSELRAIIDAAPEEANRIRSFYSRLGREISVRRYYAVLMHKVFQGQTSLNKWKHENGKPVSAESQILAAALTNPVGFVHNMVQDIKSLVTTDSEIRP